MEEQYKHIYEMVMNYEPSAEEQLYRYKVMYKQIMQLYRQIREYYYGGENKCN